MSPRERGLAAGTLGSFIRKGTMPLGLAAIGHSIDRPALSQAYVRILLPLSRWWAQAYRIAELCRVRKKFAVIRRY